ncbi:MAG TPA: alpha/beta hydrolase [Aggregatilineaceae bacterium]|nr:alpha/beta hydrolase [Aggregatilineaceae bacterium]
MQTVTSHDGTTIAYDQVGHGPALILVSGALGKRGDPTLANLLAPHFTVIHHDRRGRGDSGDTPPYAVQREVEDIEALIDAAGGSAYLYGMSSGAVLALEAASKLPGKVNKLVMYEPPLITDASRPPAPADLVEYLQRAVAEGRRGDAVEYFMTQAVLVPAEFVAQMRFAPVAVGSEGAVTTPMWEEMEKIAHTLVYDSLIMDGLMSGNPLPPQRWYANTAPTLVITGGNSGPFFANSAQRLIKDLPNAQHRVLPGQDHAVAPAALTPLLIEFFLS